MTCGPDGSRLDGGELAKGSPARYDEQAKETTVSGRCDGEQVVCSWFTDKCCSDCWLLMAVTGGSVSQFRDVLAIGDEISEQARAWTAGGSALGVAQTGPVGEAAREERRGEEQADRRAGWQRR